MYRMIWGGSCFPFFVPEVADLVVGLPMGLHSGVTFRLERGYKCGYADVGCSGCKWVLFC